MAASTNVQFVRTILRGTFLGILTFDRDVYNIYAVYGNKSDKYITSIYYDLKKEKEIPYSIIFTNDIDKILYDKRRILF